MRRARTESASKAVPVKWQSAVPNTTRPRSGSTVPEDHTLPQPSYVTCPAGPTSVWNSQTGSPVARLAAAT